MNIQQMKSAYAHHVARARAIIYSHEGKDLPLEKANEARHHLEAAKALNAQLSEPVYKHDMGADGGPRGIDGKATASHGGVRILTKDQRLSDLYDGSKIRSARGFLGVLAKSLVGDVSAKEVAHFLGAEHKSMLSTGGAGVLVPEPVSAFIIDRLRAKARVIGLGARTIPMTAATLRVPRVTVDAAPAWTGEGQPYGGTDADLDDVTFTAHKLAQIVKFSEEVDEDSDPELAGEVLADHLAVVFALELDRAALRGSGTGDEPTGVRNQTGVTVDTATGVADWLTLTGIKRDLALANAEVDGFVLNPRTLDAVENEKDGTSGQFINPPRSLDGITRVGTTAVPANLGAGTETEIYGGQWEHLLIGMRSRFELRRLNERYADEGMVALRARLRADVQLAHPEAFIVKAGVTN